MLNSYPHRIFSKLLLTNLSTTSINGNLLSNIGFKYKKTKTKIFRILNIWILKSQSILPITRPCTMERQIKMSKGISNGACRQDIGMRWLDRNRTKQKKNMISMLKWWNSNKTCRTFLSKKSSTAPTVFSNNRPSTLTASVVTMLLQTFVKTNTLQTNRSLQTSNKTLLFIKKVKPIDKCKWI